MFEKIYYVEMSEFSDGCTVCFEITKNPAATRGELVYNYMETFKTKDMPMQDCYTRGWHAFNRILSAIEESSEVKFDREVHGRGSY